jgi:hypothetical protein
VVVVVVAPTAAPAVQIQLPQAELVLPRARADAGPETVVEDRVEEGEQAGEEGDADDGAERNAESAACGRRGAVLGARVVRDVEERDARNEAEVRLG